MPSLARTWYVEKRVGTESWNIAGSCNQMDWRWSKFHPVHACQDFCSIGTPAYFCDERIVERGLFPKIPFSNLLFLVRLQPVLTEAAIGYQRDVQGDGVLHFFDDDALYLGLFFGVDAEVQLVVDLQNHL